MSRRPARPGVLILVQNLPVPFDRRVWQEALALRDAGYDVTVVCPSSPQHPARREVLEDVRIFRYAPGLEAGRLREYLVEYGVALSAMTVLAWRATLGRRLDVVQACNPPDLLFLVAVPLALLRRARFVFDHHDVCPELLVAKGHAEAGWAVRLARLAERATFGVAVVSIATNDSYREVALGRGGMRPDRVSVVRSGPAHFEAVEPEPRLRRGHRQLVGYVGVMGIQEGIDLLLDAAAAVVHRHGRTDVLFALAGDGPERERLAARSQAMGLGDHVVFLGRVSDAELVRLLSTADVCVNPDVVNAMNDISTMNKVVEYMALGRPIVQFETREGRVSAGESSVYVAPNDPMALADALCSLLDDPGRRAAMGAEGRRRFRQELAWDQQVPRLLEAYATARAHSPFDVNVLRASWWRRSARGGSGGSGGSTAAAGAPHASPGVAA